MDIETREQAVARYETLREINVDLHGRALGLLSRPALLAQAKKLGLLDGSTIVADEEDLDLLWDLALYTAPPGRTRAIERCARTVRASPGSDERIVMEAMLVARFSLWRVERRHPVAGLVLLDIFRQEETWLMDKGLEASARPGTCFGARVFTPTAFSMTCGTMIPIDVATAEYVMEACGCIGASSAAEIADHRKFATTLYRLKIDATVDIASEWAA